MLMTHPNVKATEPVKTTQAAFDKVWKDKGWKVAPDPSATTPAVNDSASADPKAKA